MASQIPYGAVDYAGLVIMAESLAHYFILLPFLTCPVSSLKDTLSQQANYRSQS